MGRLLDDWLTTYTEYTSEQESPALFHLWVGTSVIASAMERRCYINRGYYTLYPNLYIVLIGESAPCHVGYHENSIANYSLYLYLVAYHKRQRDFSYCRTSHVYRWMCVVIFDRKMFSTEVL